MKMKNFVFAVVMLFALMGVSQVHAQNKVDVYVGAQVVRVNPDIKVPKFTFNSSTDSFGANGSVTVFVAPAVGVTGELAGTTSDGSSVITGLGGLTLQANRKGTFQPFVRGLVGVARERANNQQLSNILDRSDLGLAYTVGAGVDVAVSKRVAVRVVQVDYLHAQVLGDVQNNIRVGAGIRF
jgi:opacity protein-like surface antigen